MASLTDGQTVIPQAQSHPIAQAPVTPTPQLSTPAVPAPSLQPGMAPQATGAPTVPTTTVNVSTAQPEAPKANLQPGQQGQDVKGLQDFLTNIGYMTPAQTATGPGIYGPQTQAAIAKLQKDLGIDAGQGSGFYGPKTQEAIRKKYEGAFKSATGATPQNAAEAQTVVDEYVADNKESNTQQAFFENLFKMNPVESTIFQQLSNALSTQGTKQSLVDTYAQEYQAAGLPALNLELADVKKIMDGTEDDIRTEITKAGGFATESQIQGMVGTRNKVLLKQARYLADVIQAKEDYVDKIVALTGEDRKLVDAELDRKLGISKQLFDMTQTLEKNAKTNYDSIVDKIGYAGLSEALQGDKAGQAQAERVLGIPRGALSNQSWLNTFGAPSTKGMSSAIQEYEYAKSQGYKGSFTQYQNEDANRKAAAATAGITGLTAAQINQTVNQIAGSFDNEPIVKEYNTASSVLKGLKDIGTASQSPTDDMAFIYGFAKIMDPNSAVKEGEYDTIQEYGQALTEKVGLKLGRITNNSNFLTKDAKDKMLETLGKKVGSMEKTYSNVASEYQRQIEDTYMGKPRQITNYANTVGSTDEQLVELKSKLEPGEILVARETPNGRTYMAITPDELWATDITF